MDNNEINKHLKKHVGIGSISKATTASESALSDLLCAEFLRLKRELQGVEAECRTTITPIGEGKYDLVLPCKDGQFHCCIVSEGTLRKMMNDMVNALGA